MTNPPILTDSTDVVLDSSVLFQDEVREASSPIRSPYFQVFAVGSDLQSISVAVQSGNSIIEMKAEIEELRSRLDFLEAKVSAISMPGSDDVVVLRTVNRETAKREIRELFAAGETLYYSDVSRRLKIDLEMVVEICQELQATGEIRVDDDAL